MNKSKYPIIIVISIITVIICFLGIYNIYISSDDGVTYIDTGGIVAVKYVDMDKPGYKANVQIGDTILSINDIVPRSLNDLKGNIIEKTRPNTLLFYKIKRSGSIHTIPVQITNRYSSTFVIYQVVFFLLYFITSLIFLLTFPAKNNFPLYVFLFYLCVAVTNIFTKVSFTNPYLYSILILSGSFCPFLMFLLVFFYKDNVVNFKRVFILALPSTAVFLLWLSFYLIWTNSMMPSELKHLTEVGKIANLSIALMFVFSLFVLLRSIYISLKENEKYHINYITIFLITGFIPYVILYALPMAMGKKEILSVEKTISFAIIPLLGIVIFNNFLYEKIKK